MEAVCLLTSFLHLMVQRVVFPTVLPKERQVTIANVFCAVHFISKIGRGVFKRNLEYKENGNPDILSMHPFGL